MEPSSPYRNWRDDPLVRHPGEPEPIRMLRLVRLGEMRTEQVRREGLVRALDGVRRDATR